MYLTLPFCSSVLPSHKDEKCSHHTDICVKARDCMVLWDKQRIGYKYTEQNI